MKKIRKPPHKKFKVKRMLKTFRPTPATTKQCSPK